MRQVSVLVPAAAGVGLVLIWSAVHGAQITATFKDLLAGHDPASSGPDPGLVGGGSASVDFGGAPHDPASEVPPRLGAGGNRANGQLQAAGYGWTGEQWTALDRLWTRESDWDNTALNASSGAYGIAQFLDATWASVGGSRTSDPTLQIHYGLAYIRQRYGTPAAAWAHETAQGWY